MTVRKESEGERGERKEQAEVLFFWRGESVGGRIGWAMMQTTSGILLSEGMQGIQNEDYEI